MSWLAIGLLLGAILLLIAGVGFGVIGIDSRDGRDWKESSFPR